MPKITLNDALGTYDVTQINANFQKIETALNDKVLYRDNPAGNSNAILTDVDVNGKRVYNLPAPTLLHEAARLQDVTAAIAGGSANLITYGESTVEEALDSLSSKAGAYPTIIDFGGIVADGTDQTAAINAWLATLPSTYRNLITIPYGVEFSPNLIAPNMPVNLIFLDHSMINGWDTAGFRQNLFGYIESGDPTSISDMNFAVRSGHNASIVLSNSGSSGSTSGDARVAAILWASGQYDDYPQPGIRGVAMQEFGKSPFEAGRWNYSLRKRAPMVAVSGNYNPWVAGKQATSGSTYVFASNKYYVAASTGTTGATVPSHTSGTVSDGGVSWTLIPFEFDSTVQYWDDLGRLGVNGSRQTATWNWRQSPDDPETTAIMTIKPALLPSRTSRLVLQGTTAGSAYTATPYLGADTLNNLNIYKSDGTSVLASFDDASGFKQRQVVESASNLTSGSTTPSVVGIGSLYITNAAPVSITNLVGGVVDQVVTLIAGDGNTTLVHGATLKLTGSVNLVMTPFTVVTMRRISTTTAWIEVSRSVK